MKRFLITKLKLVIAGWVNGQGGFLFGLGSAFRHTIFASFLNLWRIHILFWFLCFCADWAPGFKFFWRFLLGAALAASLVASRGLCRFLLCLLLAVVYQGVLLYHAAECLGGFFLLFLPFFFRRPSFLGFLEIVEQLATWFNLVLGPPLCWCPAQASQCLSAKAMPRFLRSRLARLLGNTGDAQPGHRWRRSYIVVFWRYLGPWQSPPSL